MLQAVYLSTNYVAQNWDVLSMQVAVYQIQCLDIHGDVWGYANNVFLGICRAIIKRCAAGIVSVVVALTFWVMMVMMLLVVMAAQL